VFLAVRWFLSFAGFWLDIWGFALAGSLVPCAAPWGSLVELLAPTLLGDLFALDVVYALLGVLVEVALVFVLSAGFLVLHSLLAALGGFVGASIAFVRAASLSDLLAVAKPVFLVSSTSVVLAVVVSLAGRLAQASAGSDLVAWGRSLGSCISDDSGEGNSNNLHFYEYYRFL